MKSILLFNSSSKKHDRVIMESFINTTLHTMVNHQRYSGAHIIQKENVAEHSYFVVLLADLIAEDIEKNMNIKLDRLKVMKMALYHDTEEAYTGDLITPVKNKSTELKKEWDKLSSLMMMEGLQHDFPNHAHIRRYIMNVHTEYETYKYDKLENQIVKFADGLQSIVYLLREIGFGNRHVNSILCNVATSMDDRFKNNPYLAVYSKQVREVVATSVNMVVYPTPKNAVQK